MPVDENGASEVLALSNICLSSVCKNIDIFNAAYETANKNLKEHLLFLRRFFSDEIIKMLLKSPKCYVCQTGDRYLHKKYFHFLINEFLKDLDWFLFRGVDFDIILEMLPKIGKTLEGVSFNANSSIKEVWNPEAEKIYLNQVLKNALLHLPNVKAIRIMLSFNCDDGTLKVIQSSCKELKLLYLESCPPFRISSDGLKSLCPEGDNTFHLQTLILKFSNFNIANFNIEVIDCDEGVAYLLKNMPSLECLVYENLPKVLHKLHMDHLRNDSLANVLKYNLTSLCIDVNKHFPRGNVYFEETLMIAAEVCPRISQITVINNIMTEEQLQMLCRFPNLSAVNIQGKNTTLDVSGFLQNFGKNIKLLEMGSFKMNLSTLVENCPNLETIHLSNICYYASEKEQRVTILNNVKKLCVGVRELQHSDPAEMFVERLLNCCPNLEELEFVNWYDDSQQMNEIVQNYCEKSQTLKKLTFTYGKVQEALLRHIVSTCAPLKKLVIDPYSLKRKEVAHLHDILKASRSDILFDFTKKPFLEQLFPRSEWDPLDSLEDMSEDGYSLEDMSE